MYYKKKIIHSIFCIGICLLTLQSATAQTAITEEKSKIPVSYATVSFGNGNGLFADDDGNFVFTKKLYPDVDSLYISALGYEELKVATANLPDSLFMATKLDELDEVVLRTKINRPFEEEEMQAYLDDDYYSCWLPTIESEIAVFFPAEGSQQKTISSVIFPITLESKDWEKRKKKNSDKKPFSTLFKVKFYANNNGYPGKPLILDNIVFRATEKGGDSHTLDVTDYNIRFPENGFFVSLQVLGYTDDNGKLLPNKKYKEIKTREGTVKIPTNFRPLLPFTDEIEAHRTYIKRVFVSNNEWVRFQRGNVDQSSLLRAGLNNYGIGLTYKVYEDE